MLVAHREVWKGMPSHAFLKLFNEYSWFVFILADPEDLDLFLADDRILSLVYRTFVSIGVCSFNLSAEHRHYIIEKISKAVQRKYGIMDSRFTELLYSEQTGGVQCYKQ